MKAITLILGLIVYSLTSFSFAADGKMPGDNLDLNAVLDLFKNSKNIEDFENKLNSEKSNINNLDLNADGFVDYIRVIDYVKDNAHLITLQVAFTADEIQDVAVIELDRKDDKTVVQIVGDEALYGRDYIVEPVTDNAKMAYNANNWTSVQYIYGPQYVVYVSPWNYGFYPHWHRQWRPYSWDVYYGYVHPYYSYYRHCGYYRSYHAHHHYYGHKSYSNTYYNSPKHMTAQQQLPVHKQSMNEASLKSVQIKKADGNIKTKGKAQREVRKVDATPRTANTVRTTNKTASNPTRTATPKTATRKTTQPIRTQPTTRSTQTTTRTRQTTRAPQTTRRTQPQRSSSSPTMRSTPQRSPQRGTTTRQTTRTPSAQPSRAPSSPKRATVKRRP